MAFALVAFMPDSAVGGAVPSLEQQQLPTARTESEISNHLKSAREAYFAGDYSRARKESNLALKLNKESPEGCLLLGMVYWREGKRKEAINHIERAIQYRPDYSEAHYYLSIIFWKTGDLKRARQEVDAAIRYNSHFSDAHYLSGEIYLAVDSRSQALDSFEETARRLTANDPGLPRLQKQIDALKHLAESKSLTDDPAFVGARLENNPVPVYSDEARQKGIQGSVRLAIEVDSDGRVTSTVVLLGLGYGLDEQAVKAAQALKFTPATVNGAPHSVWKVAIIEFNLRRRRY